jgi:hypothetical protein
LLRGTLDFLRRGKIRKSLREIDGVVQQRLARHVSDGRFGKEGDAVAEELLFSPILDCWIRHKGRLAQGRA